ncbi:PREDICTED: CD109 antigen-like, partial [Nanorana parkeri]|uniref:CD109 antigen-like n=1 Tax=Nanorana parkeri TaxID=125878 RepID=UPI0008546F15
TTLAVHWFGDSDLTLTAEIRDNISLLTNVTKVIKKDSIEIVTFPGIAKITSFNVFQLYVSGSSQNTSVFSETLNLPMQTRKYIFIQTDKFMYKPEETVKIRIITVNYDLKPSTQNVDLIIRDPRYNIVQQHLNMTSDLGVISTQFQLSSSPMLGQWNIQAKIDVIFSTSSIKTWFDKVGVEELQWSSKSPDLLMKLHTNAHGFGIRFSTSSMKTWFDKVGVREFAENQNLTIASFSVAENVFRKFDVKLDAPSFFIESIRENFTGTVIAKYPYGKPVRGNLTISMKSLYAVVYPERNKIYVGVQCWFKISGSVNFSFTHEEILQLSYYGGFNITATVYEEFTALNLRVVESLGSLEIYIADRMKPIQVRRIDSKTLTKEERGKNVSVKITQGTGALVSREFVGTTAVAVDSDNTFWRNFTISESGIVNVEFRVLQSFQWIQLEVEYQTAFQLFYFEKQTTVDPFIRINISETSLKVGTPFHLQINTYPEVQEIYYVVVAKGMVVAAGKNKTTFSLTPEHSWAPTAQIEVYKRNVNSSFGDILQTTQTLMIKGALKSQVTLSWSKNSAKPLENVTLSVSVKESRSLVALRIVEKKSTLLDDINDLTPSKVDSGLRYFQPYSSQWQLSGAAEPKAFALHLLTVNSSERVEENIPENGIPSFIEREEENIPENGIPSFIEREEENIPENGIPSFIEREEENIPENGIPSFIEPQSKPEFIETWIWLESNISSSLLRNLLVTVPDKNTTWVATAFVMSEGLGLGVTDALIELSVVKPLVMTLNMPNTLTRGEQFILEVMLLNSLKEDLQVIITLVSSNSFDIIVPNNTTGFVTGERNVTVLRENGTVVFFPIQPKVLGNIVIHVTATSKAVSETLIRNIVVRAEGVKNYYSEAALFEVRGSGNAPGTVSVKSFSFTFPSDLVQGSEEAFITVIGDLLGPSINGLESLIVMPYGCGEQNMIVFAPNIYVLIYLKATNQLKGDIREKSIQFMEQGYERELLYRHNDGSFSAFGNYDGIGSTWLTSFVLRCFLQARPFIYISPDVLNQAVAFLVQYQDIDTGIFSEPGRVIHRELQGGLNGPVTLTAYILTSLLEDQGYKNRYAFNVQKAVQYLEGKYDEGISSNYTLSVVAYALTLANSSKAKPALDKLNSRATIMSNGGKKYWSAPSTSANIYWQPRTTDIETAAYALLSFQRQNRIADGFPVMKWLSEQRNQLGGYVSTQDTVMALQALSQFAAALPSGQTSLVVTVTGTGSFVTKTFQVNTNLLELQRKQVEISQPLSVTATAVGNGLAVAQLNVVYNTKAPSRRRRNTVVEAFKLDLKVNEDASNIHKLTVDVSMSYLGEGDETGMVLVVVNYLNGFQLSAKVIPTTKILAMVEPEANKVNLYLHSLTRDTVTVSVPMVRFANVAGSQDAVVTITEYYNPRNTVTRTYNSATMKKISVCDYCGFNCTQCKSNVEVKSQTNSAYTYTPTFFVLCISMVLLSYLF